MDYDEWIERERLIRSKLLNDSTRNLKKKLFRVCEKCGEICLCHEQKCPNCDHNNIITIPINNIGKEIETRIRCRYRYRHMNK
jgi:uncharacterized OB-fold protein